MKIVAEPRATKEQCIQWLKNKAKKGGNIHPLAYALMPMIYDRAVIAKIDPCVAVAQSMIETGYFTFKGVLRPNFCNVCGLKVTKGGGDLEPGAHMRFEYWEDGIQAFIDHLALYAGAPKYPKYSPECNSHTNSDCKINGTTLDPRHFTYLKGTAVTVESLEGKWCPSKTYDDDIIRMVNEIIDTKVENNGNDNLVQQPTDYIVEELKEELNNYKAMVDELNNRLETLQNSHNNIKNQYKKLYGLGKDCCNAISEVFKFYK